MHLRKLHKLSSDLLTYPLLMSARQNQLSGPILLKIVKEKEKIRKKIAGVSIKYIEQ